MAEARMGSDEAGELLEGVERFVDDRLRQACARPEVALLPAQLAELTAEATALGIVSAPGEEQGCGIWDHCDGAPAMTFNVGALRRIAAANPGVAFHWHRAALARRLAARLGLAPGAFAPGQAALVTTGHFGLGRASLARWLVDRPLDAEDHSLLRDWLDRATHATTLVAAEHWTCLLWPVWQQERVAWQFAERSALDVERLRRQHGFDDLGTCAVRGGAGSVVDDDPAGAQRLYREVLALDLLGLVAIGAGAIDHAAALAVAFAAGRRQGGQVIARHPAVAHMLGGIRATRHLADATLAAFSAPVGTLDLASLAAARAWTATAFCHAANEALQVHGGLGYMRDAWPERLLRDSNMLRLASGGIRDIPLFLDGWGDGTP